MPKKDRQNIVISSRAGNERVESAIPKFQSRYGMDRDQATAVAIRLESAGRLHGSDGLISRNTKPFGPGRFALAEMAISRIPKRNRTTEREKIDTDDMDTLRRAYATPKRKLAPKRIKPPKPRRKRKK